MVVLVCFFSWKCNNDQPAVNDKHKVSTGTKKAKSQTISQDAAKEAARLGTDFLKQEFDEVNSNSYVLMHYLQRKFDVDLGLSHAQAVNTLSADKINQPTLRYIDKSQQMSGAEISVAKLISATNTRYKHRNAEIYGDIYKSLYCQNVPLTEEYLDRMQEGIRSDAGSMLMHTKNLVNLLANNCDLDGRVAQLKTESAEQLVALIHEDDGGSATSATCISMLYLLGEDERVLERWIYDIQQRQDNKGDWAKESAVVHMENVFSLHCLLEYAFPDKQEPYVVQ